MQHNLGPARREFFAPEFFLVVLLAFGLFSVASVRALFGPLTGRAALLFDDHRVWTLMVYQLPDATALESLVFTWADGRVTATDGKGFEMNLGEVARRQRV